MQFRIDFQSSSPYARAKVDFLSIDYSTSLVAREVVGEVSPRLVSPGETTSFTYVLFAVFGPENSGFDAIRISTPVKVNPSTIRDLLIDGSPSPFSKEADYKGLTIHFPENRLPKRRVRTTDSVRVAFTFDSKVLMHGTRFEGKIFDSRTEEVPQDILPGDATPDLDTNDLIVGWRLGGDLITAVEVSSEVITPNGDGVNDAALISYGLLQLTLPTRVSVSIHDLSGPVIFERTEFQTSGLYSVQWDGRDERGRVVLPGVYVYRIVADVESGPQSQIGTIAVVY